MSASELSAGIAEKVNEYQVMSAPLEQAIRELEFAQSLLKARAEHDIAQAVPALGALVDVLEISSLDLLMAPDRMEFLREAMAAKGLTADQVGQQMRALVSSPESHDDLKALGLSEQVVQAGESTAR